MECCWTTRMYGWLQKRTVAASRPTLRSRMCLPSYLQTTDSTFFLTITPSQPPAASLWPMWPQGDHETTGDERKLASHPAFQVCDGGCSGLHSQARSCSPPVPLLHPRPSSELTPPLWPLASTQTPCPFRVWRLEANRIFQTQSDQYRRKGTVHSLRPHCGKHCFCDFYNEQYLKT